MARKNKNSSPVIEGYLKTVAVNVASKGKPNGDFLTVMGERVKAEIKSVVPANYRLAVRMAVRRKVAQLSSIVAAI